LPPSSGGVGNSSTAGRGAHAPQETCIHCHGARWVRVDVPFGHPRFGEIQPCTCWNDETQDDRRDRLIRYSNLGALARFNFSALLPAGRSSEPEQQRLFREAVTAAWAFAENPAGWLLLTGPSGSGKTHLAAAIAHHAIEAGRPALFMVVPDLLDHLRAAYAPDSDVAYDLLFEQVREAPLLLLDDFGSHSSTPWAQEKLFQVLNHRQNLVLPTVIVLSCALDALDVRLRTRLADPAITTLLPLASPQEGGRDGIGAVPAPLREEMTFQRFDTRGAGANARDRNVLMSALALAKGYAESPEGHWLVLMGPTGVGKTHLAVAIVNKWLQDGNHAFYARVPDLLDHLRAAYAPSSSVSYDQRFEELKSAPFLVLDGLGSQNSTPWANEKLDQLIHHRHDNRLPTVITVNPRDKGDKRDDGDDGVKFRPSIASRLGDMRIVVPVEMEVSDYRDHAGKPPAGRRQTQPRRGAP
jgi:DNA replication protein DnaC